MSTSEFRNQAGRAVLAESLERRLRELHDNAVLLGTGGWAQPLARADAAPSI